MTLSLPAAHLPSHLDPVLDGIELQRINGLIAQNSSAREALKVSICQCAMCTIHMSFACHTTATLRPHYIFITI